MKPCVGTKIVRAKPFTYHEYKETYLDQVDHGDEQDIKGYIVEYPDGYKGWNSKGEFEYVSRGLTPAEYSFLGVTEPPEVDGGRADFYVTTKILGLNPLLKANTSDSEVTQDGYQVIYPNGHQSWSPKDKADEVYRSINKQELILIKNGLEAEGQNESN